MKEIFQSISLNRLVIFIVTILFLIVLSCCIHGANSTHHTNDTGSATCELYEKVSSIALSKESIGALFIFTLLILSFSLISTAIYFGRNIYQDLTLLYIEPIRERIIHEVLDPFLLALKKGIIHPKLHSTVVS